MTASTVPTPDLSMSLDHGATKWSKLIRQIKDDETEELPEVDTAEEPESKSEREETTEHMAELSRSEVCSSQVTINTVLQLSARECREPWTGCRGP